MNGNQNDFNDNNLNGNGNYQNENYNQENNGSNQGNFNANNFGQNGGNPNPNGFNGGYNPNFNNMFAPPPPTYNGFAIASLVLGIVSIVCCCLEYFALVPSCLAIIFALVYRTKTGRFSGVALGGLICGIVGTVFIVALIIYSIVAQDVIQDMLDQLNSAFIMFPSI